jgi:hypothetical protein
MKIKSTFVTNSSSATYIIVDVNNLISNLEEELIDWEREAKFFDYFEILEYEVFFPNEIDKLKTFNNYGEKLDWVQEATGPPWHAFGSRELYKNALREVANGKTIHFIKVNNNMNLSEFLDHYENLKTVNCSDWGNDGLDWRGYE